MGSLSTPRVVNFRAEVPFRGIFWDVECKSNLLGPQVFLNRLSIHAWWYHAESWSPIMSEFFIELLSCFVDEWGIAGRGEVVGRRETCALLQLIFRLVEEYLRIGPVAFPIDVIYVGSRG